MNCPKCGHDLSEYRESKLGELEKGFIELKEQQEQYGKKLRIAIYQYGGLAKWLQKCYPQIYIEFCQSNWGKEYIHDIDL